MISDEYRQKLYDGLAKKKGRPSPESPWWSDAYEEMIFDEEFILDSDEWPDHLYKMQLFWCDQVTLRQVAEEDLWPGELPDDCDLEYVVPPTVWEALDVLNAAISECNKQGLVNWWAPSKQAAVFDTENLV